MLLFAGFIEDNVVLAILCDRKIVYIAFDHRLIPLNIPLLPPKGKHVMSTSVMWVPFLCIISLQRELFFHFGYDI